MRKDEVKKKIKIINNQEGIGKLYILKLSADGCTVGVIKNTIKRINSKGDKIDVLILDYLDCLSAEKEFAGAEDWSNEGKIMRQVESMTAELNIASWVATQGNRSSTSVEVVKTENMGGNLKKAQIAHLIVSVGKTLEQKENGRATITILKNRMGSDGMIFQNCLFDNKRMLIDTEDVISIHGFEDKDKQNRQKSLNENLRSKWEKNGATQ